MSREICPMGNKKYNSENEYFLIYANFLDPGSKYCIFKFFEEQLFENILRLLVLYGNWKIIFPWKVFISVYKIGGTCISVNCWPLAQSQQQKQKYICSKFKRKRQQRSLLLHSALFIVTLNKFYILPYFSFL